MAPELLKGDYDSKVDIWSIGVIAFSLLSSSLPFFGKDRVTVMKKILKSKFRFSSERWLHISNDAKDFIIKLLQPDPKLRPDGMEVLEHIWIKNDYDISCESNTCTAHDIEEMDKIQASLQVFANYRTLKKLALMVVAYKSTSEEIGFLRKLFNRFDRIHDGEITIKEFKDALINDYSYTDNELEELFNGIDIDGTGKVHYIEFLAATIEAHGTIEEERLAEAFDRLDCDSSGYITFSNLKEFLGNDIPDAYIEKVIEEADIVHDQRVSYDEFLELWNKDDDDVLIQSKINVQYRRKQSSISSSAANSANKNNNDSSLKLQTSNDSYDDTSTILSEIDSNINSNNNNNHEGGDFYFSQRKFLSMRKVEIDMKDIKI